MQSFQSHLSRVLRPRLRAFPALELQVWLQLCEMHDDVAREVALWLFALPASHPELDSWIRQIHSVWRTHFVTQECYDGVLFLPQRSALLKRPVLALFQHRHVASSPTILPSDVYPNGTTRELFLHGLVIRFYGNERDVERMKQRSWNVLMTTAFPGFQPMCRYGSILQLQTRLPQRYWRTYVSNLDVQCLDNAQCGHKWPHWPNHDFMFDRQDRELGLL